MDLNSITSALTSPSAQAVLWTYIAYQVFSALVQSLPPSEKINNVWYTAIVNFLSILAADFKSFAKAPSYTQSQTSSNTNSAGTLNESTSTISVNK
jgi:hypothetical protein